MGSNNNSNITSTFINGMMKLLLTEVLEKHFSITFTEKEKKEVLEKTIKHYIEHKKHYVVCVSSLDPFKFIAWSGKFFSEKKKGKEEKEVLLATILAMEETLRQSKQGKSLPNDLIGKLLQMLVNDSKNDEIAIGKNGLYMAFRCASEVS